MEAAEIQQLVRKRRYLSIKEGAELLGVKARFLYNRIGTDKGPPYRRRGRHFKLPTYEFLLWCEKTETP